MVEDKRDICVHINVTLPKNRSSMCGRKKSRTHSKLVMDPTHLDSPGPVDLKAIKRGEVRATRPVQARGTRRKFRRGADDENMTLLRNVQSIVQANQHLMEQLIKDNKVGTGREQYIKYVADTLRDTSPAQYKQLKAIIN